jgi:hypothetical protein
VMAKPQRKSRDELRELLLQTGRSMLREEGLASGAEALTFKRVFERVEQEHGIRLTNASVIRRVWDNLAEFQTDVLIEVARTSSDDEIEFAVDAAGPALRDLDLTSPASREAALVELCRVGGAVSAQAVLQSKDWPLSIGVWALSATGPPTEERKRIGEALLSGFEAYTERIEALYGAMVSFLGLRLREPFTLHDFFVAEDSLSEGYGLRNRVDAGAGRVIRRPTGPGGEEQEWTIFAVALEALMRQFFELDPDWHPRSGANEDGGHR